MLYRAAAGAKGAAVILVFGSINIDVLVPVPALPAAGETVLGGDRRLLPGGKGANQALAARQAGAAVSMAGAVGEDSFAEAALAGLRRAGVDLDLVRRVALPTGCALIIVAADGENLIAVSPGANRAATAAGIPDALLGPGTTLVCQMEIPPAENRMLLRRARAAGARTLLNLAPALALDAEDFADIDILVVNQREAAAFGGDPAGVARRLGRAYVVTRGAAGAVAFLADGGRIDTPALTIEPIDTTGAGDAFVGILAAGLDAGLELQPALRRASAGAALACLAQGAQNALPDRNAIAAAAARLPG